MIPFRENLRLLLRAGVPAGAFLILLVAVLLWRVAALQEASANEDRADQAVVLAASLATDFVRMQNGTRAALLTRDVRFATGDALAATAEKRFGQLFSLLTEQRYRDELGDIQAT